MDSAQRVRIARVCGIIGGVVYFLQGIASLVFSPQFNETGTTAFAIGGVGATITFGLVLIGLFGLAWGGALGGRFDKGVFALAALGYLRSIRVGGALVAAPSG